MSRYIDADRLCEGRVSNDPVVIAAKCEPTADVAEVRHGEWEYLNLSECWQCSDCGVLMRIDGTPKDNYLNYCPNCGAKMDGKTQ